MSDQPTPLRKPDGVLNSLLKIDSSIRNGQFLYAHRELRKLYAELSRGEYGEIGADEELTTSLRRTDLFLRPMVKAYSQNQTSLDISRRKLKCQTSQSQASQA